MQQTVIQRRHGVGSGGLHHCPEVLASEQDADDFVVFEVEVGTGQPQ